MPETDRVHADAARDHTSRDHTARDHTVRDHAPDAWVDELGLTGEVGLVTRVARLNLFVSQLLESLSQLADLNAADYLVVAVVCRSPGRQASPARMAELLGRSTGGLSLTIDRLVKAGLVERSRHPEDGRRTVVTATAEGYRRWQIVSRALREVERELPLDPAARAASAAVLDDLIAVFERGRLDAD